jgi:hypothetical protein
MHCRSCAHAILGQRHRLSHSLRDCVRNQISCRGLRSCCSSGRLSGFGACACSVGSGSGGAALGLHARGLGVCGRSGSSRQCGLELLSAASGGCCRSRGSTRAQLLSRNCTLQCVRARTCCGGLGRYAGVRAREGGQLGAGAAPGAASALGCGGGVGAQHCER